MKKFSFGLFFLTCWIILVSTGLFLYLGYLQPTKLGATISSYLKEKTQLEFDIESVTFSFSPKPAVNISNIVLYDTSLPARITIKNAYSELSWRSLILFKPVLKHLTVSDVDAQVTLPRQKEKQAEFSIEKVSEEFSTLFFNRLKEFSIPHYFSSLQLTVSHADGEILDPNHSVKYRFKNFNALIKTPDILDGDADLSLDELAIFSENYLLFHLGQTKIQAKDVSYNPRTYSGTLLFETNLQVSSLAPYYDTPIREAYRYFPMPKPSFIQLTTDFNIKIRQKTIALTGKLYNKTVLPMNSYATPIELTIPFTLLSTPQKEKPSSFDFPSENKNDPYRKMFLQENTLNDYALDLAGFYINEIQIKNAVIKADTDSLMFTGALTGLYPFNPLIFGKAHVEKFSLPRWIGPTREMNGGLYNALNAIQADIDVFCTLKGVFSPNLTANVLNYTVKGKSVTADFAKADICFDLEMLSPNNTPINLNELFPEINGKETRKVKLPPPAVVIAEEKSSQSDSPSVSYHINIHVPQQLHIWKLDCANAHVLIAPDKKSNPTINVNIGNCYTGSANALVTLYSTQKHEISATLQKILIEAPLRAIIGHTVCTGHADGAVTVKLRGENFEQILNSLEIKGNVNLSNGAIHSKERLLTHFAKLAADIALKTEPFNTNKKAPESFALSGLWQLNGEFPEYTAKIHSKDSSILFSTHTGEPLSRTPQLTDILFKEKATNETLLNGTAKLGFNIKNNKFIIENYKGALKNSKLIANITYEQKEKTYYHGDLYFQHLNLSDYIKDEKKPQQDKKRKDIPEENTAEAQLKEDKELPLDFICNNNVNFSVKADKLTFYDITTNTFTGNIKIVDNKISINNLKTNIKNGFIQALLEGSVQKQNNVYRMQTKFKLKGTNLDMLSITKMRKQDTLMSGAGNIAIQGNALVSKTSDIFKTMNAEWSMQFNNGYFQSSKDHAVMLENRESSQHFLSNNESSHGYTGKTNYTSLSASGTITNGIAQTKNISLIGTGLLVQGEGIINLVTEKINAFVHATYLGIPEIPIYITGSISDPKYEVKVMTAVSKTIGNIGAGVLNIFSNLIVQPFKLFTP